MIFFPKKIVYCAISVSILVFFFWKMEGSWSLSPADFSGFHINNLHPQHLDAGKKTHG